MSGEPEGHIPVNVMHPERDEDDHILSSSGDDIDLAAGESSSGEESPFHEYSSSGDDEAREMEVVVVPSPSFQDNYDSGPLEDRVEDHSEKSEGESEAERKAPAEMQVAVHPRLETGSPSMSPIFEPDGMFMPDHDINGVKNPFKVSKKKLGDTIISVENVVKNYKLVQKGNYFRRVFGRSEENSVKALSGVSLNEECEFQPIRRGEFVMIRGKSGCGKTTLLNCIGTIDKVTSGNITIHGTCVSGRTWDYNLANIRLREIGFVFQTYNLISTLSAVENVALPMNLVNSGNKTSRMNRSVKLLRMVELADRLGHLPSELSGGEQQRVTIARALSNNPPILLLDEPTGSLATKQTVEIMDLLLRINLDYGKTLVMVTHNPDLECYADRILYMKDGKFVKQIINDKQRKLDYYDYYRYLKTQEELRRTGYVDMFG